MHEQVMCLAVLDPWSWLVANEKLLQCRCVAGLHGSLSEDFPAGKQRQAPAYECLCWKHLLLLNISPSHDWHVLSLLCMMESQDIILGPHHLSSTLLLSNRGACDDPVNHCGEGASFCHCWPDIDTLHLFINTSVKSTNIMDQALRWAQGFSTMVNSALYASHLWGT